MGKYSKTAFTCHPDSQNKKRLQWSNSVIWDEGLKHRGGLGGGLHIQPVNKHRFQFPRLPVWY